MTREETVFKDGASDLYSSEFEYDFYKRRTGRKGRDGVAVDVVFDSLSKVTQSSTYADLDDDFELNATELRARTAATFDDQQRVYPSLRVSPRNCPG